VNPQKLISTVITLGTGLVATKAISLAWKGVTGHEPPKQIDADDGEVSVVEIVIFAAVSAAVAALVRSYVTKGTAKWLSTDGLSKS
jgi:hypothetical protein